MGAPTGGSGPPCSSSWAVWCPVLPCLGWPVSPPGARWVYVWKHGGAEVQHSLSVFLGNALLPSVLAPWAGNEGSSRAFLTKPTSLHSLGLH